MRTLTVRLPTALAAEIEAESRARRMSKSDVVRERMRHGPSRADRATSGLLTAIADLIGSVDDLPADLSTHVKRHLRASRYGQKRSR
jgi:Arc/MetJ-type ribon-helix-helix transcriptional regulator